MPKNKNTSASPSTSRSKPEIHLFENKNYEEWRLRFVTALTREGVRSVLKDSNSEEQYLALEDEDEREEKMATYATLQGTAQSILFNRLRDQHLRQIKKFVTVRQILNHLDQEFRVTSKIGLANAGDEYQQLRFQPGNDMAKFIKLFEKKADQFEEAGGELKSEDKVTQLSIAIPNEYDAILDWYEMQNEETRTYEMFSKKVVEKFNRIKLLPALNQLPQNLPNANRHLVQIRRIPPIIRTHLNPQQIKIGRIRIRALTNTKKLRSSEGNKNVPPM